MPADMFLKLDGIQGESTDSKHKNEIEIDNYSFGVSQQGTSTYGGGLGAGKAQFQDFHFSKRADKATPNLFVAVATGKHISEALLTVRKAGGQQEEYLKVTMKDVLISNFSTSGSEGAVPLESISFNFTEVKIEYSPQQKSGSLEGSIVGGYNVKKNEKI
ncbi:Hcp family type VI secretion system effector [Beijerinckia mobilis]|uniref:Hcp family type VI secretion system effector n=1 Tax=Beijerinckia mobilis TaxID=231434 RepID=UPI00054E9750|nr:type VI secretion system tube protein Hcp [Beijerinckia mobilis]